MVWLYEIGVGCDGLAQQCLGEVPEVEEVPVPMAIICCKQRIKVERLYPYPVSAQEQGIVFKIVSKELDLTRTELLKELQHLVLTHIFEVVLDQRDKVGFSWLDRERNTEECPLPGILVVGFRVDGAYFRCSDQGGEFCHGGAVHNGIVGIRATFAPLPRQTDFRRIR